MKDLCKNEQGSVAIMSAFGILAIVMICALVLETSSLYVDKLRAQRTADIANLAAANTSSPIVNGVPSKTALATAQQMAVLNGFAANEVLTTVTNGGSELSTQIQHAAALGIGKLLTQSPTVPVDGFSSARVTSADGECIRSLWGAISIFDNAVIDGPTCTLAAAAYLYICGHPDVTALALEVKYPHFIQKYLVCPSAAMAQGEPKFTYDKKSVDPLAADTRIVAIKARLAGLTSWDYGTTIPQVPLAPTVPLSTNNKTYSDASVTMPAETRYGQLTVSNSTLTFTGTGADDPTCMQPTTIYGNILLSGTNRLIFGSGCYAVAGYVFNNADAKTSFETAPGAKVTLAFKQFINNEKAKLTFGNMRMSIAGAVLNVKGGSLVFGDGPFSIGGPIQNTTGVLTFGDGPFYLYLGSITNGTGTVSFGNGAFYLWGGAIANLSTGTLSFGNGPFVLYGGSISNVGGVMTLGNGPFEFRGGSVVLYAGSETTFGTGDMNLFGGSLVFAGKSVTLGSGGGDAVNGSSSVFLYGGGMSITADRFEAVGTTFALYLASASLSGNGTFHMTAPTGAKPAYGYTNILFYSYGGAFVQYQGAVTDTMSGTIYAPQSAALLFGSQTVNIPDEGCLQIVAGMVSIFQKSTGTYRTCLDDGSPGRRVLLTR